VKTNRIDVRALKAKHRLELVMQETGEVFEVDPKRSDLWRSLTTPGLTVDLRRQLFEIKKPATVSVETGDVIAWLRYRYGWSFGMALRYLERRTPDPEGETQPARRGSDIDQVRDERTEPEPLDHLQQRALEICGDRIQELLSWSLDELVTIDATRISPVDAPGVEECAHCGERFDWEIQRTLRCDSMGNFRRLTFPIPIRAYSIKREGEVDEEEDDEVVCLDCALVEHDFQVAFRLVKASARRREEKESEKWAEFETKRIFAAMKKEERDRIAAEEKAQNEWECDYLSSIESVNKMEADHET